MKLVQKSMSALEVLASGIIYNVQQTTRVIMSVRTNPFKETQVVALKIISSLKRGCGWVASTCVTIKRLESRFHIVYLACKII